MKVTSTTIRPKDSSFVSPAVKFIRGVPTTLLAIAWHACGTLG